MLIFMMLGSPVLALTTAESILEGVSKSWTGDYSGMKKDKVVRVLMPYSITSYYLDITARTDIPKFPSVKLGMSQFCRFRETTNGCFEPTSTKFRMSRFEQIEGCMNGIYDPKLK
jgi:hypothetical protein